MKPLRSVAAVVAGFLLTALLVVATDRAIAVVSPDAFPHPDSGRHPALPWLLAIIGYSFAFAVAGGWMTGRLAPARPLRHAVALGLIAGALGALASIASWGQAPGWYQILLPMVPLGATWLGGRLAERGRLAA